MTHLRVGADFVSSGIIMQCTGGARGIGWLDEFMACQKFWSADSGSSTVEAEPQADSPTTVFFFPHCTCAR